MVRKQENADGERGTEKKIALFELSVLRKIIGLSRT